MLSTIFYSLGEFLGVSLHSKALVRRAKAGKPELADTSEGVSGADDCELAVMDVD